MRLNFRHGVVSAQSGFLTLSNILGTVSLITTNKPTVVTLAHRTTNYIHSENNSVTNAWTGIVAGVNAWLYWDFNLSTFARTFAKTLLEPIIQPTEPTPTQLDSFSLLVVQNGRIWYNTAANRMFERDGVVWREVLRVFSARVLNGITLQSLSINAPLFTGTQIGNTSSVRAGRVLFDESSRPIRRTDGTFFTSEDQFFTSAARIDALRLESNVSFAQSAVPSIAQFSIVAYDAAGKIKTAQYDDIGSTVLAVLTEDVLQNGVGSTIIQGVITNPAWLWSTVGAPLWVNNGLLIEVDPHVVNNITFPIGRVPIARVLSPDTVVFEQGLGGKGDQGNVGPPGALAPATITQLGTGVLSLPPVNPLLPIIVGGNDPRLADARTSLPHSHAAIAISFSPIGTISSNTVQGAIEELGTEKVAKAGDTLTGFLTLHANPVNAFHAATKSYVDAFVSGLIWLNPIAFSNLISDALNVPPVSPVTEDMYIVAPGGVGVWVGLSGRIVEWNGVSWLDRGMLSAQPAGTRFGISFDGIAVAGGTFAGQDNNIAILTNPAVPTWSFAPLPVAGNAVFVNNDSTLNAFHQYVYTGTRWIEFGAATPLIAGNNITQIGNTLNVDDFGSGGTIDAKFLQGFIPGDFALVGHTHMFTASQITFTPYTTSPNWGTISSSTLVQLNAINVQNALQELEDEKAPKTPLYATLVDLPVPATVHGMVAQVTATGRLYFSFGGAWVPLANQSDLGGTINIPYDLVFFMGGSIVSNVISSSSALARNVFIKTTNPHIAICNTPPATTPVVFDLQRRVSPYTAFTSIGTVTFAVGNRTGTVVIATDITINATDLLQIKSPVGTDIAIKDVSITLIGCAAAPPCSLV